MNTTFTITPRKAGIFLGIVAVVMSALAITGDLIELFFDSEHSGNPFIWPIARQFNFVEEGNIANFYQGLQLVLAAVLLLIVWRGKVQRKEPHRTHWLVLGCIFLFLGTDEVAQIHETTIANTIANLRHHESDKTGWFWIYLPLLAIFGLSYIRF
jgi:amino acid transporter